MKRNIPLTISALITLPALAAILPFAESFDSGLGEFTVEDANNDGVTIKPLSNYGYNYTDGMQYVSSANNAADDWLFTPAFNLKKGYLYTLTYRYQVKSSNTVHKVEWKAGSSAASADMSVAIAPEKEFTYNFGSWDRETIEFTVPEDGEYHLGMHLLSAANQGGIYFDDIEISDGLNPVAPVAPTVGDASFRIVDDKLSVSFPITIPTQKNNGDAIDAGSEITVIVGREDDANIGSVKGAPGETVTFTDPDGLSSWATYHFHCVLGEEESAKTDADSNPRFGDPKPVENFTAILNGNEFTLSWDAVTEAENENDLLIPSQVTYLVKCNGENVANNISDLTATYTFPMPEEGQMPAIFTVVAFASGHQSSVFTSAPYMVGNPYTGEFKESFAGRAFSNKTWVIENNKGWSASIGSGYSPVVNPQDEDGGCLEFALNGTSKIWSPVLDLSTLQNPKLKFYAYLYPTSSYETTIQPGFLVNGEEIAAGNPISLKSGVEGWTEFIIDLPTEAQENNCQLMFTGTGTNAYSGKFFIDNVSIRSYLEHNIAVELGSHPKSLEIGKEVSIPVIVENKGSNAESDYTLTLFADGEKVAEAAGPEVEPMEKGSAELTFKARPKHAGNKIEFKVVATLGSDGDNSDNEAVFSIPVNENDLERVPGVNASVSADKSTVTLNWEAPVVSTEPSYQDVVESFETWESWSLEAENGWTFIDVDQVAETGINNKHKDEKRAAMVVENFEGVNVWDFSFASADGSRCIIMGVNSTYNGEIDDWIISPEVKGGTTVTFKTTLADPYSGSEAFSVLWSAGGTSPEDFTEIDEMYSLVGDWAEKSFDLPRNAKRFAIRMHGKHYKSIAFDTFTFTSAAAPAIHTGFNVYRDHELMATYPAATLTHVDQAPVMNTEHTYHVTAIYDKGESHYSDPVKVNVSLETGIGEIEADASETEFFTLQGLRIDRPVAGEIVIVRKGDKRFKAIVK